MIANRGKVTRQEPANGEIHPVFACESSKAWHTSQMTRWLYRFFISLAVCALVPSTATCAPAPPPLLNVDSSDWQFAQFGQNIGDLFFRAEKINGRTELFYSMSFYDGNSTTAWQTASWDPESKTVKHSYVSTHIDEVLWYMRVADFNSDGRLEVMVQFGDEFKFYDAETKSFLFSFLLNVGFITDMKVVDYDADGDADLMLKTWSEVILIDGLSNPDAPLTVSGVSGIYGDWFLVGEIDGDKRLEVITSYGEVIDTATWITQWRIDQDYQMFGLIDRNQDGISEILAQKGSQIVTIDGVVREQQWQTNIDGFSGSFFGYKQLDADPAMELIFREESRFYIVDSLSLLVESTIDYFPTPSVGHRVLAIADVDNDGMLDVIYKEDRLLNGTNHFGARTLIVQRADGTILWESDNRLPSFEKLLIGDADGDGVSEMIVGTDGFVMFVDRNNQNVKHRLRFPEYLRLLDCKDINNNGRCELLFRRVDFRNRSLHIYELTKDALPELRLVWENSVADLLSPEMSTTYTTGQLVDINKDGAFELVAGWSATNDTGGLEVWNIKDKKRIWASPKELGGVRSMCVSNMDNDASLEVAATFLYRGIKVWDLQSGKMEFKLRGRYYSIAPLEKGFVTGDLSGYVSRFAPRKRGYAQKSKLRISKAAIEGVTPDVDERAVWATTENQVVWLPQKLKERFVLGGESLSQHRVPIVHSDEDEDWLYIGFSNCIRGFRLNR